MKNRERGGRGGRERGKGSGVEHEIKKLLKGARFKESEPVREEKEGGGGVVKALLSVPRRGSRVRLRIELGRASNRHTV